MGLKKWKNKVQLSVKKVAHPHRNKNVNIIVKPLLQIKEDFYGFDKKVLADLESVQDKVRNLSLELTAEKNTLQNLRKNNLKNVSQYKGKLYEAIANEGNPVDALYLVNSSVACIDNALNILKTVMTPRIRSAKKLLKESGDILQQMIVNVMTLRIQLLNVHGLKVTVSDQVNVQKNIFEQSKNSTQNNPDMTPKQSENPYGDMLDMIKSTQDLKINYDSKKVDKLLQWLNTLKDTGLVGSEVSASKYTITILIEHVIEAIGERSRLLGKIRDMLSESQAWVNSIKQKLDDNELLQDNDLQVKTVIRQELLNECNKRIEELTSSHKSVVDELVCQNHNIKRALGKGRQQLYSVDHSKHNIDKKLVQLKKVEERRNKLIAAARKLRRDYTILWCIGCVGITILSIILVYALVPLLSEAPIFGIILNPEPYGMAIILSLLIAFLASVIWTIVLITIYKTRKIMGMCWDKFCAKIRGDHTKYKDALNACITAQEEYDKDMISMAEIKNENAELLEEVLEQGTNDPEGAEVPILEDEVIESANKAKQIEECKELVDEPVKDIEQENDIYGLLINGDPQTQVTTMLDKEREGYSAIYNSIEAVYS